MATAALSQVKGTARDLLLKVFPGARAQVHRLRNLAIDAKVALFPGRFIGRYVLPEEEAARGAGCATCA